MLCQCYYKEKAAWLLWWGNLVDLRICMIRWWIWLGALVLVRGENVAENSTQLFAWTFLLADEYGSTYTGSVEVLCLPHDFSTVASWRFANGRYLVPNSKSLPRCNSSLLQYRTTQFQLTRAHKGLVTHGGSFVGATRAYHYHNLDVYGVCRKYRYATPCRLSVLKGTCWWLAIVSKWDSGSSSSTVHYSARVKSRAWSNIYTYNALFKGAWGNYLSRQGEYTVA